MPCVLQLYLHCSAPQDSSKRLRIELIPHRMRLHLDHIHLNHIHRDRTRISTPSQCRHAALQLTPSANVGLRADMAQWAYRRRRLDR